MMKKILAIVFLAVALFWVAPAFAAGEPSSAEKAETEIKKKIDTVFPADVFEKLKEGGEGQQEPPTGDFKKDIIPQAIKIILALAGTVSFGVFVYAGVMLVISQGNEEEITKFKNILIWSIVGLIFITTSYALVSGVMKLSFT